MCLPGQKKQSGREVQRGGSEMKANCGEEKSQNTGGGKKKVEGDVSQVMMQQHYLLCSDEHRKKSL